MELGEQYGQCSGNVDSLDFHLWNYRPMYRSPLRAKTAIRYRNCLRWQNNVPGSQSHGKQEDSTLFAKAVIRLLSVVPLNAPCRVIVNQAHCFATGGSFDNGLPFSLSMGCGTWGGNSISENLNYRHYLNIVRIVRPIPPVEPSDEDIFGEYWAKHGR